MTTTRSISWGRKNKTNVIVFELDNELFPLLKNEIIKQNSLCAENYKGNKQTVSKSYQHYSLNHGKRKKKPNLIAIVVAFQNDTIVGYQTLHNINKEILKIDIGCVDVHRRGSLHGLINLKLTKSTRSWAKSKKYSFLFLDGLPSAESSWKRQGFKRLEFLNNIVNFNKKSVSKMNNYNKSVDKCTLRDGCLMYSIL